MQYGIDETSVLRRTLAGQREAVAPQQSRLDAFERRLLLLFNGVTSLGSLLDAGFGRGAQVDAALAKLLRLRLIEVVPSP